MGRAMVRMLNGVTRLRRARCRPEELLILMPACLQNSDCKQNIKVAVSECRRCGRCKVRDILALSEKYGVRCAVASGGRLALQYANEPGVRAVVAVACEKELRAGLTAVFPKPGLGVVNLRPHGPCRDTDVDLAELEEAVAWFLRPRGNARPGGA